MIYPKFYLIIPGCPRPSIAFQWRIVAWNTIHFPTIIQTAGLEADSRKRNKVSHSSTHNTVLLWINMETTAAKDSIIDGQR